MKISIQLAIEHYQSGRFADAEAVCRRLIKADATNADAAHLLGIIALQSGKPAQALPHFDRATALNPASPFAYNNRGEALRALGRSDDAEASYRRALAITPQFPEAHNNLGVVLQARGRLSEALASFDTATRLKPDYAEAQLNLGSLWRALEKSRQAVAALEKAVAVRPDFAEAYVELGSALHDEGRLGEEEGCYRQALSLKPGLAIAHKNLGALMQEFERFDEAHECYKRALKISPNYAEAVHALGTIYQVRGKPEQALLSFRKAIALKPNYAQARWALPVSQIPIVVGPEESSVQFRAEFARELGVLASWVADHLDVAYQGVGIAQPFYLAYQEENNRELLKQYGDLCVRAMAAWRERQDLCVPVAPPGDKPRIGIVSAHVREHSVWNAIVKGWIERIDRQRFELQLFHVGNARDRETEWAEAACDRFTQGGMALADWVKTILSANLDVLIYPEIGMDALTVRLAASRLAPVQVASWGHPETTGLSTIDYYLSADAFEPESADSNYSETLVTLPNLGCCYAAPPRPPVPTDVAIDSLASGTSPIFLCPGTPAKYAADHDWVFPAIARKVGDCRFLFFLHRFRDQSEKLHQRLEAAFVKAGLRFSDYCLMIPWQNRDAFHALMKQADVFLDTIGFSGFNTAIQAIECGLPIVTRDGRYLRGRLASGLLRRMGLADLVVATESDYVEQASRLATDRGYRDLVRKRIVTGRDVLFDDTSPIRGLEDFLAKVTPPRRTDSPAPSDSAGLSELPGSP